jgi:hypothetical protein
MLFYFIGLEYNAGPIRFSWNLCSKQIAYLKQMNIPSNYSNHLVQLKENER